jgi:hypothetical protein
VNFFRILSQNLSAKRFDTVRSFEYTLPGGLPRIKLQTASLANWILLKQPRIWILESATTILTLVAFSIAYLVLPFSPHIRPMHLLKWSPCKVFTSLISKVSRNRSSSLKTATASQRSKPSIKALMKSAPFYMAPTSSVAFDVLISTALLLVFMRTCSFMCSTRVLSMLSQFYLRGVNLCRGTGILLYSFLTPKSVILILSNSISLSPFFVYTVSKRISSSLSWSSSSMFSSTPAKAASVVCEISFKLEPSFLVSSRSYLFCFFVAS